MTDQPTTWTPELEDSLRRVIKSVDTIQLSYFTQQLREKVGAALESAAAEIERQKARADAAEQRAGYIAGPTGRVFSLSDVGCIGLDKMPESVQVYGSGDMGVGEVQTYVNNREVERLRAELATVTKREADGVALFDDLLARERAEVAKLRAELAAKQTETRTPLPEAKWVKIPLQHESGLTTWNGKRLRDLSAAEFDACKADAARGIGSMEALLGVAEEARVRRALAEAEPVKAEAAQQGPSDEFHAAMRQAHQSSELNARNTEARLHMLWVAVDEMARSVWRAGVKL